MENSNTTMNIGARAWMFIGVAILAGCTGGGQSELKACDDMNCFILAAESCESSSVELRPELDGFWYADIL